MSDFAPQLVELCRRQPHRARLIKGQLQVLRQTTDETLKAIYVALLETEQITDECFAELRRLKNELNEPPQARRAYREGQDAAQKEIDAAEGQGRR